MEDLREELVEATPETPIAPKPKKVKKTPSKPTRIPEDLEDVSPKKMTDKEKDLYIAHLREYRDFLDIKCDSLANEIKSAYERVRNAEDSAKRVADQANLKLNLIRDNVKIMANNVMTILEK